MPLRRHEGSVGADSDRGGGSARCSDDTFLVSAAGGGAVRWFVMGTLIAGGVIHLLPAVGVAGPTWLARLYDVEVEDPDIALLLRHRAALFGIVGVVLLAGAVSSTVTALALAVGLASTVTFLVLAGAGAGPNPALRRVAAIDVPLAIALAVALVWHVTVSR